MSQEIKVTEWSYSCNIGSMISGSCFLQKNVEGSRHLQEVLKKQPVSMRQPVSLFTFGEFSLYEGKNSFNLMWAGVENYFDTLKKDLDLIYYASYFCELASYLTRENNDELEILKLLYQTLRALEKKTIDIELVRCIYEIKILALYGIGIEASRCVKCGSREDLIWFDARESGVVCNKCEHGKVKVSPATLYTLQYILYSSIEKLYTFKVSADVLWELKKIIREYMRYHVNHEFKSLLFL